MSPGPSTPDLRDQPQAQPPGTSSAWAEAHPPRTGIALKAWDTSDKCGALSAETLLATVFVDLDNNGRHEIKITIEFLMDRIKKQ